MPSKISDVERHASLLSDDEKRALVRRVEGSSAFHNSQTLRAFLIYVADRSLANDFEGLKEQQIGSQVLGRRPDYDPAEDNIVRVRARQLRQKLDEYFSGEGHGEPVVMSVPKGHYVSVFELRSHAPREEIDNQVQPPTGESTISLDPPADSALNRGTATVVSEAPPRRWKVTPAVLVAIAVFALASLSLGLLFKTDGPSTVIQGPPGADVNRALWGQFFPVRGQELVVVTADSGAALWQDITHHTLSLGDYVSRKYLQDESGSPEMREIATRRYTSPTDLTVSLRLAEIAQIFGGRVKAQFARSMDIHDLRNGNIVLLGSRRSNPWVELFEPQMNFVLDVDGRVGGPCFRNRAPQPGERSVFPIAGTSLVIEGAENKAVESYAVAALLPSVSGRGMVLILEGLNMEGTEAAAEFVTNRDRFSTLTRKIGLQKETPIKAFQVLLKLTSVGGGYANPEIVAYRYGG